MNLVLATRRKHLAASSTPSPKAARRQRGQGMTEYIIIVALIAVSAIATYRFFGQTVRDQTAGIAQEVAGQSAATAITQAQTAGNAAQAEGAKVKGLDKYNSKN